MKEYIVLNEGDNQKLFSFAKWSNYYLFPLLTPVICFSTKFFLNPMEKMNKLLFIDNWIFFGYDYSSSFYYVNCLLL